MRADIGIIGLGLLGSALAQRLHDGGYRLHGFDPATGKNPPATLHPSPQEVFANCDTVFFSLPQSSVSAAVIEETKDAITSSHVVLDTTTGSPDEMIAISKIIASRGAAYLEANVAGSSEQLRRNEATFFVGGDPDVAHSVDELLRTIAPIVHYLGPVGTASRFKLVHNLILGLNRAALAEGLRFAESLGFDPSSALSLLDQTPAASHAMSAKGRRMAERDYDPPQARLKQHLKDVRLMLEEAKDNGITLPLSDVHRALLEQAAAKGFGDADNSAIREAFED